MSSMAVQLGFEDEPACAQCCPNMTYRQRIMGFAACSGLGWIMSTIGSCVLFGGFTEKNITTFILLYVFGNFLSLGGTLFLCGPKKQCTKMWDKTRRWSTAFYLSMLIIVFCVAITQQHIAVIIVMLFIEILSGIWYSASYIPFGRNVILSCLRGTICGPCFRAYDWCAEKCGKVKKSVEKNLPATQKKSTSWFGTEKKSNSWFGSSEEKSSSSWFGSDTNKDSGKGGGLFGGSSNTTSK